KLAPQIIDMLSDAEMVSEVRQALDLTYSALAHASPCFHVISDAPHFLDPYFYSGVHLVLTNDFAAAVSV
ncbi:hypothetical protein LZ31DRAFT_483331, partial [Colletotrichum somersetense]